MNPEYSVNELDMRDENAAPEAPKFRLHDKLEEGGGIVHGIVLAKDFDTEPLPYDVRRYYNDEPDALRGYTLLMDGNTLVDRNSTHLVNLNLGQGVSRYPILDDALSPAEIEARWERAHNDNTLPRLNPLQPSHSIGAYTYLDPSSVKTPNYLVVTANDGPAAANLIETVSAEPMTLGELHASELYTDLIKSSAHHRDALAAQTAAALGIKIGAEAEMTTLTHQIVPAEPAAHGSIPRAENNGVQQYVVLNDTIDTSSSHKGAMIAQGPMGGYAHVERSKPFVGATGIATRAWRTDSMSTLGANAPHHGTSSSEGSEHALHRHINHESRELHDKKVHWGGTLSTAHPRSDEKRALMTQRAVHTLAKPKEAGVDLRVVPMKMIAVQLHDHEPLAVQTTAELAALAKQSKAASLPVPLDSEVMRDLTRHFDALADTHGELADVMNNSVRVPLDAIHTTRSACKAHESDPAHYHYWHDHVYEFDKERDALLDEEDQEAAGEVPLDADFVEEAPPLINYALPVGERMYSTTKPRVDGTPAGRTHVMLGTKLITDLHARVESEKAATKAAKKAAALKKSDSKAAAATNGDKKQ